MKQAIRALGIATKILWVLVIIFSVTAVYSAANLRISIGKTETSVSDSTISLSTPLFINNTGFYEITDLNITTQVKDHDNRTISTSTTLVPKILPNNNIQKTYNITLNIKNLTRELSHLAFNDSVFNIRTSATLRFANIVPIQLSTNSTMPWGAPLYNFSIGDISLNYTKKTLIIPLSFENHAFFNISGTIRLDVYNSDDEQISTANVTIEALSGKRFENFMEMDVDLSKLTDEGQIYIFFETSVFAIGPIVKSWVISHGS